MSNELSLSVVFTGHVDKTFEKVLTDVNSAVNRINTSLKRLGEVGATRKFRDMIKSTSTAIDQLESRIQKLNAQMDREKAKVAETSASFRQKIASLQELANKYREAAVRSAQAAAESAKANKELKKSMEEAGKSYAGMTQGAKKAETAVAAAGQAKKKTTEQTSLFGRAMDRLSSSFRTLASYAIAGSMIYQLMNAFKAGAKEIIDFDQALHNLKAISGATNEELAQMNAILKKVAIDTKFSTVEAAEGMVLLAQAGFSAGESIQSIEAVARLAAGTLSSFELTTDLVTTTVRAFGLQAVESARVSDVMANAINKSKLTIDKLRIAFNYVGATASQAGISLEDTAASMMVLANNGLRASTIGTGLRQVLSKLLGPTDKIVQAFANFGLTLEDIDPSKSGFDQSLKSLTTVLWDQEKQIVDMRKAFELFGLRGAQAAAILVRSFRTGDFDRMRDKTLELGTAQAMAEEQAKGLAFQLKNLADSFKVLAVTIGEGGLVETLSDLFLILKGVVIELNSYIEAINRLSDWSSKKFGLNLGLAISPIKQAIFLLKELNKLPGLGTSLSKDSAKATSSYKLLADTTLSYIQILDNQKEGSREYLNTLARMVSEHGDLRKALMDVVGDVKISSLSWEELNKALVKIQKSSRNAQLESIALSGDVEKLSEALYSLVIQGEMSEEEVKNWIWDMEGAIGVTKEFSSALRNDLFPELDRLAYRMLMMEKEVSSLWEKLPETIKKAVMDMPVTEWNSFFDILIKGSSDVTKAVSSLESKLKGAGFSSEDIKKQTDELKKRMNQETLGLILLKSQESAWLVATESAKRNYETRIALADKEVKENTKTVAQGEAEKLAAMKEYNEKIIKVEEERFAIIGKYYKEETPTFIKAQQELENVKKAAANNELAALGDLNESKRRFRQDLEKEAMQAEMKMAQLAQKYSTDRKEKINLEFVAQVAMLNELRRKRLAWAEIRKQDTQKIEEEISRLILQAQEKRDTDIERIEWDRQQKANDIAEVWAQIKIEKDRKTLKTKDQIEIAAAQRKTARLESEMIRLKKANEEAEANTKLSLDEKQKAYEDYSNAVLTYEQQLTKQIDLDRKKELDQEKASLRDQMSLIEGLFRFRQITKKKYFDYLKQERDLDLISENEYQQKLKEAEAGYGDLVIKGLAKSMEATEGIRATITKIAEEMTDKLTTGFTDMFMSIIDGSKNAGQAFQDFARGVLTWLTQMIVRAIIWDTLMAMLPEGGFAGLLGLTKTPVPKPHTGGIMGKDNFPVQVVTPSFNIPKFHDGGISRDETLALLRKDEGVFTPAQMKAMGGSEVNIINVMDMSLLDQYFATPRGQSAVLNVMGRNPLRVRRVLGA